MRYKVFFCLAAVFLFSAAAFSQSVIITPKKTVYRRLKPESDYRRTFTITYPKVKAASLVLSRKIESVLSFEKNFELNLKEEIAGEYQWLESGDYRVGFNRNGVLSIELFIEGSGAYPSTSVRRIVVDLQTGNRIKAPDAFANPDALAARVRQIQREKIEANYEDRREDEDFKELREDIAEELKDVDFTAENLEGFTVDDKGVTFHYDYGFRHAIRALEPDGDYFLAWTEIKPFIKPAGLLGKFVR
ncbi:MAG TPA: hypothetical protein VIL74_21045 [Pyrinomonadaceae bacterium]|jgi:hypothetical protein